MILQLEWWSQVGLGGTNQPQITKKKKKKSLAC